MKPFPWRAGMRRLCDHGDFDRVLEVATTSNGMPWLCVETDEQGALENGDAPPIRCRGWIRAEEVEPDPNDGTTKGALLEVVREAWKDPGVVCSPALTGQIQIEFWEVWPFARHLPDPIATGPSEFTALLAAWEAAP